mmetsp:Transcript_68067/g.192863  ORF Transcript_68067/g.192863 Transcript_68067/m.192863 type:complete len:203 (-) Transcript_68067:221-829(-)
MRSCRGRPIACPSACTMLQRTGTWRQSGPTCAAEPRPTTMTCTGAFRSTTLPNRITSVSTSCSLSQRQTSRPPIAGSTSASAGPPCTSRHTRARPMSCCCCCCRVLQSTRWTDAGARRSTTRAAGAGRTAAASSGSLEAWRTCTLSSRRTSTRRCACTRPRGSRSTSTGMPPQTWPTCSRRARLLGKLRVKARPTASRCART